MARSSSVGPLKWLRRPPKGPERPAYAGHRPDRPGAYARDARRSVAPSGREAARRRCRRLRRLIVVNVRTTGTKCRSYVTTMSRRSRRQQLTTTVTTTKTTYTLYDHRGTRWSYKGKTTNATTKGMVLRYERPCKSLS